MGVEGKSNGIRIFGTQQLLHKDHFKLYIFDEKNKFKGTNWFEHGDKVKLVKRGKIGWEHKDWTIHDGIVEDKVYTVDRCCHLVNNNNNTNNYAYLIENATGAIHPDHFEKIE